MAKNPTQTKPKILLLYTGGTFGLGLGSIKKQIAQAVPELSKIANWEILILAHLDSAHIDSQHWKTLAQTIKKNTPRYDGFVILHGTDTLAYTACALSFLLHPCKKPVVLTGAQRPLAQVLTDAHRNLIASVEIAAHAPRPGANRVMVFFGEHLYQGNRVKKRSAKDFEAFESQGFPPLAHMGTQLEYSKELKKIPKDPKEKMRLPKKLKFNSELLILQLTPHFPAKLVREKILPKVRALIFLIFPSGTAPTHDPEFLLLLKEARGKKIPLIVTTESEGPSSIRAYEPGRRLLKEGCLWAGPMTPEYTFIKAGFLLGSLPKGSGFYERFKGYFS